MNDKEELDASFKLCPRYHNHPLTDEQIELIIDRALEKAKCDLYQGVGKTVVGWVFYIIGVFTIGLAALAKYNGWFK